MASESLKRSAPDTFSESKAQKPRQEVSKPRNWEVTIDTAGNFYTFLKCIRGVAETASFLVCTPSEESDFMGLQVEEAFGDGATAIICQYECAVTKADGVEEEDMEFTMRMSVLENMFKCIMGSVDTNIIRIVQYRDSAPHVHLNARGDRDPLNTMESHMITQEPTGGIGGEIANIPTRHIISVNVGFLKNTMKTAEALGADTFSVGISTPTLDGQPIVSTNGLTHNFLTLGFNSDVANPECTIHSSVTERNGSQLGVTEPTPIQEPYDAISSVFKYHFLIKYVSGILRHFDRESVTIMVQNECPLIVEFAFGSDRSFIRLLQAPKPVEE